MADNSQSNDYHCIKFTATGGSYGITPTFPIHAAAQAIFAGLIGTMVSATFLTQGFTWPIYTRYHSRCKIQQVVR